MVRSTFAGTPPTIVYGATSPSTTAPTATTAFAPIRQGPTRVAPLETHTPSSTTTSRPVFGTAVCRAFPKMRQSCVPVSTDTP